MSKNIFKAIVFVFIAATLGSCTNSPEQKAQNVEEAKTDLVVAKQELQQARLDSMKEYLNFKEASERKLKDNDAQIATLKYQIKSQKTEMQMDYNKQLEVLTQKNENLKTGIRNYKESTKEKWETFKMNFNVDLDSLGKTISMMSQKNKKNN